MRKILLAAAAVIIVGALGFLWFYKHPGSESAPSSQVEAPAAAPASSAETAAPVSSPVVPAQADSTSAPPAASEPAAAAPAASAPNAAADAHDKASGKKGKAKAKDHKPKSPPAQ